MQLSQLTPITVVHVLKDVPLDSTYKDTFTFASASIQSSYFIGKAKRTYTNLTPVRLQNAMRLPVCADELYDCNYIMFQNANFSNKWFYAFITAIEFININMCLVKYDIDVFQTWAFDYTVKPSFVEREHPTTDNVGDNLVRENLDMGELVADFQRGSGYLGNAETIIVASTISADGTEAEGQMIGGIYSGLQYTQFNNPEGVNGFIRALTLEEKQHGIVSIFQLPTTIARHPGRANEITIRKPTGSFGGYRPKNNKLYTYPYCFLYVTNCSGAGGVFKYEYFGDADADFYLIGNVSINPEIVLVPLHYKGSTPNWNERMSLTGFPQCAWNTSSFADWLANNGVKVATSTIGNSLALSAGIAAENPQAIISGGSGIANAVAEVRHNLLLPPQAHGADTGDIAVTAGFKDFFFYNMRVTAEYAKIIDDYFSMFGYAVHEVKIPSIYSRPSWNYVKTIDAKIVGSIPFEDINTIRNAFDRGITFWHGDWIGDYNRDNQP